MTPMTSPLTPHDASAILALATLAALSDGQQDDTERTRLAEAAASLGFTGAEQLMQEAASGAVTIQSLAAQLTTPESKQLAYDTAAAVCHANGWINPSEGQFLRELATLLGADTTATDNVVAAVNRVADDTTPGAVPAPSELEQHILDQAIITAALEILPDRLANLGILPLQLRLVHHIGQLHGAQTDINQVKDLAATFGLGAAAQVFEKVVRRTFGGLAGGLLGGALGGMLGGAGGSVAGLASGAAVTFASTYALGHAADQYYKQGRELSTADLKTLFARFRADAETMYPRVEARVRQMASGASLDSVLRSITR
jgi:tellurite resistance protein/uncharacterized protein (DUF697 family)